MIDVKVEFDAEKYKKHLRGVYNQLPFATSKAINTTLWQIKEQMKPEMKKVFRNPTPYTLNSVKYKKTTKHNLTGNVRLKDKSDSSRGNAAADYLMPQIIGGRRKAKKSEQLMRRKLRLSNDVFWKPAKDLKLNKYGNIPKGKLIAILRSIETEDTTNQKYFVVREKKGRLYPGVYQRMGKGKFKPVIMFIRRQSYRRRFNFVGIAKKIYNKNIEKNMYEAIEYALKTAR